MVLLTFLMMNQSCDSAEEEIDLQGNNVFELQYINTGMSGEIIKKKTTMSPNEFIRLQKIYGQKRRSLFDYAFY